MLRRLHIRTKTAAALSLVALSTALAGPVIASTKPVKAWTGFGAKLSDWKTAHPKNSTDCMAGGCYGGRLRVAGQLSDQFIALSTGYAPAYRVIGFEEAFNDGSSIASSKAAILKLLPSDTKTTAFWVEHDSDGNSCANWNLQSKTLAGWFSGKYIGDPSGVVGVVLDTIRVSGPGYNPNNINDASIGVSAMSKGGAGC